MPRYFLELAYRGTHYSGFQIQENANTIQAEVEKALQIIFRCRFALTGSSRTDAGVHANQNFFHVDSEINISQKHLYNLNALLPADIAIKEIYQVPDTAHCRFDATAREYKYFIYGRKDPFITDRGWLYPYPLKMELLQEAAAMIKDYQDFTSFSKRNTQVKTFLCQIEESEWYREGTSLIYHIKANRFLRGMVRGLVGTMLRVGRQQMLIDEFRQVIEEKNCKKADFSTPPQGLFLEAVIFKPDIFLPLEKQKTNE